MQVISCPWSVLSPLWLYLCTYQVGRMWYLSYLYTVCLVGEYLDINVSALWPCISFVNMSTRDGNTASWSHGRVLAVQKHHNLNGSGIWLSVIQFRYLLYNFDIDQLLGCLEVRTMYCIISWNWAVLAEVLGNDFSVARIALMFGHTTIK